MTRLPPRRVHPKMGVIERAPHRVWPRHRRYVKSFGCSVPMCDTGAPIEFAHYRTAANAGTGLKPADWNAVSLCSAHHEESHRIGIKTFELKYRVDLSAIAREFAKSSPDNAMKEAMRACGD